MIYLELTKILTIEKLREFTQLGGNEWCKNNFYGQYNYDFEVDRLQITEASDYAWFLLRWS